MNDAKRIATTRRAAGRLGLLAAKLDAIESDTNVIGRMRDERYGPAAQRCDSQRSGASVADPTFRGALAVDRASHDLAELDRTITRIAALVETAWSIVDRYPPPRFATEADRLALTRANVPAENGCENCSRIRNAAGAPFWEPVRPQLRDATDVGGRLAQPLRLCRWCYDAVSAWGRLPSEAELTAHHAGKRVPWPKDVPRPS